MLRRQGVLQKGRVVGGGKGQGRRQARAGGSSVNRHTPLNQGPGHGQDDPGQGITGEKDEGAGGETQCSQSEDFSADGQQAAWDE